MAGPEIRESVTMAGRVERARVARAFVGGCRQAAQFSANRLSLTVGGLAR
jgi:hypothetical protein